MAVLIDTSVWSRALRRTDFRSDAPILTEFSELVRENRAEIIGPVRQEILSGIKTEPQYEILRSHLRAFIDLPVDVVDYERAALLYNRCRTQGVQGSHTDFLICAVAQRYDLAIFTVDRDFQQFGRHLKIKLHRPR